MRTYLRQTRKGTLPSVTMRRVAGQADIKVYRVQTEGGRLVERVLTEREYDTELYWHTDHSVARVLKTVRTFLAAQEGAGAGVFCSLEVYSEPATARGRCILNVSARQAKGPVEGLPVFLRDAAGLDREVTDDAGWSEHKFAALAGGVAGGSGSGSTRSGLSKVSSSVKPPPA